MSFEKIPKNVPRKPDQQRNQDHPISYVEQGTPTGETSKRMPTRVGPEREASSGSGVCRAPVPQRSDNASLKEEAGATEAKEADEEHRGRSRWARVFFGDDGLKDKPTSCPTLPRETINTYTDGGVKNPANDLPDEVMGMDQDDTPVEGDASLDTTLLTFSAKEDGDLKQWASLPGQRCSSARVETAAAIISLIRRKAVHMGTDSTAMMSKARKLQTAAVNWMDSVANNWRPSRNPFGKPQGFIRMETYGKTCGRPR